MNWDLVGEIAQRVLDMWPYVLFIAVGLLAVVGIVDWFVNSKYHKAPWEKREAKAAKKREREEERKRKAFLAGK